MRELKHRAVEKGEWSRRLVVLLGLLALLGLGFTPYPAQPVGQTPLNGVVTFDASSLNQTPPDAAIRSIALPVSGMNYPGCMRQPQVPELDYKPDNLALGDIAMITSCGWQPDEVVTISLRDPQGKITTSSVKAVPARNYKGVYEVDFYYQPGLEDPEGKYRFTFEGTASTAAAKAESAGPVRHYEPGWRPAWDGQGENQLP